MLKKSYKQINSYESGVNSDSSGILTDKNLASVHSIGKKWVENREFEFNKANLQRLFINQIPGIRIKSFATEKECVQLVQSIRTVGFQEYENTIPPIGRIGITQYENRDLGAQGMERYFNSARDADKILKSIATSSFDPVQRLISMLSGCFDGPVGIAHENSDQPYFAGLIRQITRSALIHADFACFDAPDWKIGRISSQLSWNLCVHAPETNGECVVYNKMWRLSDERNRMKDSYGYEPSSIEGVEYNALAPKLGDLIIFNSRNFHEVRPCEGDRITISSFIGLFGERELLLWS